MPQRRALAGRNDSLLSASMRAARRTAAALAAAALAWASSAARADGAADGGVATSGQRFAPTDLLDAGPTELPDSGPAELEGAPVEVVAQRPRGSERAPAAAATVVEASRFAGEVRSVAELLATAPGVALHSLGGPGQAATLSLRGAAADQSLVLLDGVPLAGPGGGAVDLTTLPAALLDRAVISRGVLGAQLGHGALGGVVELVPRAAADKLQGGVQGSFGSFGTAQLATDLAGGAKEGASWLAALQLDRTAGSFGYERKLTPELRDAPFYDETRANADGARGAALLRLSSAISDSLQASALAQASAGERGLPGPIGGFTPHARARDASWVAGGRLLGLVGPAIWSVRAWGRGSWIELRGVQVYGDCVDGDPGCSRTAGRSHAGRAEAELRLPVGEAQSLSALVSGGGETASGDRSGSHERPVLAAAVADEVRLLGGRLVLHPAVRIERVGEDVGLSPGIAAVGKPFDERSALGPIELRAGWGRSFRAATFAELYLDQGAITPNSVLQPERAWSVDAGLAYRTERFTASVGGFYSRYANLILYEQNPPARIKPFNIGAARIAGLEAQILVALPHQLSAEASYTFLDAVNQRDSQTQGGQQLAYRPPHRLFARGAHRGSRFEGYLELDATAAMPRNAFGTASLPARLLVNAGAGVRAVGPLWLDLEVKNLLDDRTQQDLFQYPLPGLSVAAIARARL